MLVKILDKIYWVSTILLYVIVAYELIKRKKKIKERSCKNEKNIKINKKQLDEDMKKPEKVITTIVDKDSKIGDEVVLNLYMFLPKNNPKHDYKYIFEKFDLLQNVKEAAEKRLVFRIKNTSWCETQAETEISLQDYKYKTITITLPNHCFFKLNTLTKEELENMRSLFLTEIERFEHEIREKKIEEEIKQGLRKPYKEINI